MSCRICASPTEKTGHLYRCQNPRCGGVYWDKKQVKRLLNQAPENLESILRDAEVPEDLQGPNAYFVYVLRLRRAVNAVYVGMTGHHPYRRYLNHITNNRASRHARKNATALINYEGPMTKTQAEKRERELAEQLRLEGKLVRGGH